MFLDRRGGRGIKKNAAKPPLTAADGVVDQPLILLLHHPVCASKDASRHFLYRRSHPSYPGGERHTLGNYETRHLVLHFGNTVTYLRKHTVTKTPQRHGATERISKSNDSCI